MSDEPTVAPGDAAIGGTPGDVAAPVRRGPTAWLAAIGPAIIVASVVLGPGSILISSKVGTEYGYGMMWVLAIAVLFMIGMVALCARLGILHDGSMCDELAASVGRPATVFVGLIIFLIVACYQTSNNGAVLAALEPLFDWPRDGQEGVSDAALQHAQMIKALVLVGFNGFVVVILFALRGLYKKLESLMKGMVMLMVVAFLANLIFARPSLIDAFKGLIPSLPSGGLIPTEQDGHIVDPLLTVLGMIMTTFSVAGAFYQAYLVREKGWKIADAKQGMRDSVIGITTLGVLSAMIMMTSAAVLHGHVQPSDLKTVTDVSQQLEPAFGRKATLLFSVGIFAGAFNPFIINAIIGGTLFSDALGLGSKIDGVWPKVMTTGALAVGMVVALLSVVAGIDPIGVIVFAQALTVLGVPVLAVAVLGLAIRAKRRSSAMVPMWMPLMCGAAVLLTVALALRTAYRLYLQLT
ncbi:MAG: hypothetical protein GC159_10450 [Phycisphaera sp.]|nr:hypothetical protein [Phycisphaera sp.]